MTHSISLITLIHAAGTAGVADGANRNLHLTFILLGLFTLALFLGGLEFTRLAFPRSVNWDRILLLFGRIVIHTAWMYAVIMMYTRVWRHFNVPKAVSFQFFTLTLLAAWWTLRGRIRIPRSPYLLPGAFFVLIMVVMCFFSVNMAEGWEDMVKFTASVIFAILVGCFLQRLHDIRLFTVLLGVVAAVVALYGLGQYWDWPLCYHAPSITSVADIKAFFNGLWRLLIGSPFQIQIPAINNDYSLIYADIHRHYAPGYDLSTPVSVNIDEYWTRMPKHALGLVLQQHLNMMPMKFTDRAVSFMGNENYTAEFVNLAFPICLCMFLYSWGRPLPMAFFSIVTIANLVNLVYIDCNASYVGLAAAVPLIFVIFLFMRGVPWLARSGLLRGVSEPQLHKWARKGLFIIIVLAAAGSAVLTSTENPARWKLITKLSWVDLDGDYKPDGAAPQVFRLECMDSALRTIEDCFPLGIGPGNFKVIHPRYENQLERKVLGEETLARKVHNDILYHAVEYGVLGMFGFIWMMTMVYVLIFSTLATLRRQDMTGEHPRRAPALNSDRRSFVFYFLVGCCGSVTVALVSCNFGHTFSIPGSMVLFYLIVGAVGAVHQRVHEPWPRFAAPEELESPEERKSFMGALRIRLWSAPGVVRWVVAIALISPISVLFVRQMVGEIFLKSGMNARESNRFSDSLHYIGKAEAVWPYQMESFYILGRYCIDAFQTIEKSRVGEDPMGYIPLIAKQRNQPIEQVWQEVLAKAYQLEPEDNLIWLLRGIRVLQIDLYMNPNYKWAHNNLGVLYEKLLSSSSPFRPTVNTKFGQDFGLDFPRRSYLRTLEIDEEQIYGLYNMGLGYMRDQKSLEAIEPFERALAVDPQKTDIYLYLANCYFNAGKFIRSMSALDRFVELSGYIDPSNPDETWKQYPGNIENITQIHLTYRTLANTFYNNNDMIRSSHCFKRAFQARPDMADSQFLYFYGTTLSSGEVMNQTAAVPIFKQVIEKGDVDHNTMSAALRYYIISINAVTTDPEPMLWGLERLAEVDPQDSIIRFNLARVKVQAGRFNQQQILEDLIIATQLDPEGTVKRVYADPLFATVLETHPEIKTRFDTVAQQLMAASK